MCKIFTLIGIDPAASDAAYRLVHAAAPLLSASERDGYGYVATDGVTLGGERWLRPVEAWRVRESDPPTRWSGMLDAGVGYRSFGHVVTHPKVIASHARTSTNRVSIRNVHPFYDAVRNVGLIHNGVVEIRDGDTDYAGADGCDSASILAAYSAGGCADDFAMLQTVLGGIYGWHACVVVTPDHVDVWRHGASLHAYDAGPLGLLLTTSEAIPVEAAKVAKVEIRGSWRITEDVVTRLTPGGAVIARESFRSPGSSMPKRKRKKDKREISQHESWYAESELVQAALEDELSLTKAVIKIKEGKKANGSSTAVTAAYMRGEIG